jgi:hypothetical protein
LNASGPTSDELDDTKLIYAGFIDKIIIIKFVNQIPKTIYMKNLKILFVIILSTMLTDVVMAQDCSFYSLSEGMVTAYQNQDTKGKVTSTNRSTCLSVSKVGAATIFKMKSEYADAKNKNQSTKEYQMKCEGGEFYVDMQSLVDPKSMEAFKGMEVSVDSKDLIYPAGLATGQVLPDASITISAASGGVSLLNLVINITNRQVVGNETVTVPAGTFGCYKITYDVETKMMFKINATVAEYVNMGVGNVKTETFDKKGNLSGTTLLVELKK